MRIREHLTKHSRPSFPSQLRTQMCLPASRASTSTSATAGKGSTTAAVSRLRSPRCSRDHLDSSLNADLHEIIPGKFIAVRGPTDLPAGEAWQDLLDADGNFAVGTQVARDYSPQHATGRGLGRSRGPQVHWWSDTILDRSRGRRTGGVTVFF